MINLKLAAPMTIAAFMFFALANMTLAQLELPPGLQDISQYNQQYAIEFLKGISLPIAFAAGMASILSPCILPLLPAFFAYTFKEKRNITRMTFIFFLGFMLVFVAMGLAAAYLGSSIISIQSDLGMFIVAAGMLLIALGVVSLFGRGFSSFIRISRKPGNDMPGILLMGVLFALGWTACVGPILAGVLLMASVLGNFAYGGLLLAIYSLGIFVPLIVISLLYDRYNLANSRLFKGRVFSLGSGKRKLEFHSTNIISGALFIIIGILFVVYRGTYLFNDIDPLGLKLSFYDVQRLFINMHAIDYAFILAAMAIVLALLYLNYRRKSLVWSR